MVWPQDVARRLRSMFQKREDYSLPLIESLVSAGDDGVSSTQPEGLSRTENLNLQQWSSLDSSVDSSRFSGEMSDVVSLERQRKEELAAMAPSSECSILSEGSRCTEQWVDEARRRSENERWHN